MKTLIVLVFLATVSLASAQHIEWEKHFGGAGPDEGFSVLGTSDNGFIILGTTSDVESSPASLEIGYLIRTDSLGNIAWEKTFSSFYQTIPKVLLQDGDRGYTAIGEARRSQSGSETDVNIYVAKLDANGTLQHETTIGSLLDDHFGAAVRTTDGGFAIAASTKDTSKLYKFDNAGTLEWQKSYGPKGTGPTYALQQTSDGGYILGGYTTTTAPYLGDIFLLKTEINGKLRWLKGSVGSFNRDVEVRFIYELHNGGYHALAYDIRSPFQTVVLILDAGGVLDAVGYDNRALLYDIKRIGTDSVLFVGGVGKIDSSYQIEVSRTSASAIYAPPYIVFGTTGEVRIPHSIAETADSGYIITGTFGTGNDRQVMLMKIGRTTLSDVRESLPRPTEMDLSDRRITPPSSHRITH